MKIFCIEHPEIHDLWPIYYSSQYAVRVSIFRPQPYLVYYRFFGSLVTNFGVIYMRNWGFTLKFAKTTPKKGYFWCFEFWMSRFGLHGSFGSLIKNFGVLEIGASLLNYQKQPLKRYFWCFSCFCKLKCQFWVNRTLKFVISDPKNPRGLNLNT